MRHLLAVLAVILPGLSAAEGHDASQYAGLQTRAIKSLSEADIDDLRAGRGWSFALAAELNGVPGPAHLLELKGELGLNAGQVATLEEMFRDMQAEAQAAADRFIGAEAAIEAAFRQGNLSPETLKVLVDASAAARAELRLIHLSRHLQTLPLLTAEQIALYPVLRGYGAGKDCGPAPEGHAAGHGHQRNCP